MFGGSVSAQTSLPFYLTVSRSLLCNVIRSCCCMLGRKGVDGSPDGSSGGDEWSRWTQVTTRGEGDRDHVTGRTDTRDTDAGTVAEPTKGGRTMFVSRVTGGEKMCKRKKKKKCMPGLRFCT